MNTKIIDNVELLILPEMGDEKGLLVAIENNKEIPFEIKRIFYIYKTTDNVIRGKHANKQSSFLLISVNGACKILVDNGKEKQIVELNQPNMALLLGSMIWKDMYDFSEDCILLVLSNEKYNLDEYVKDYDQFLKLINC